MVYYLNNTNKNLEYSNIEIVDLVEEINELVIRKYDEPMFFVNND